MVETALTDELLATGVDAEEEIEHQSHYRHEIYDHGPSHRLHRLAIVHQDMQYRHHLYYLVDNYEEEIHSVHKTLIL